MIRVGFQMRPLVSVYFLPHFNCWFTTILKYLYLVAGTFEDQIALLDEVKGELEVQVGALAQGLQVGAELPKGGVIHLAIERDVVLDLRAAVDAVQDVALQILVYGIVLLQAVQRDAVKRQVAGDVLSMDKGSSQKLVFKLYWYTQLLLMNDRSKVKGVTCLKPVSSTCNVVLTVTTSLSQGGNLLMVLVRKDTMVSP